MARDLIVRIIGDDKSLQSALLRDAKAVDRFGNTSRSGLKKFDDAFTKSQKLAAGGFIGGALAASGVAAIKSFVEAASESQKILGQTQFALEQTGKSWADYGKQIESSVQAQSKLGFDDEALLQTFTQFVRTTGDVNRALRDNALAMDIARGAHIDLERAAQVVNKAELGMAGAIRRLGIDTGDAKTNTELLAKLQEKFGGAAVAAGDDASTAMDRLNVSVENVKEALGGLLLPAVANLADGLASAADTTESLTTGLQKLGGIRIPAIKIPFTAEEAGGGTLGGLIGKVLSNTNVLAANPIVLQAKLAKALKDQFDGAKPKVQAQVQGDIDASPFTFKLPEITLEPPENFDQQAGVHFPGIEDFGKNLQAAIQAAIDAANEAVEKGTKAVNADKAEKAAAAAKAAAEKAAQARRDAFAKILGSLQLGVDRAGLTKRLDDDLDALKALKTGLLRQIKAGVDVAAAQSRLVEVEKQIADTADERARNRRNAARAATQASQFRALGLSGSGDEIVPGVANLAQRLKGALSRIESGDLDVGSKLANRLKAAQKLIRTEGGKLTEETRRQIDAFLKAATGKDSKVDTEGPLTKGAGLNTKKILAGLGLDPTTINELRSRLSHVNSSGLALAGNPRIPTGNFTSGQPIAVDSTVNVFLDGDQITRTVTRGQQVTKRRNPPQKRGPNRSGV